MNFVSYGCDGKIIGFKTGDKSKWNKNERIKGIEIEVLAVFGLLLFFCLKSLREARTIKETDLQEAVVEAINQLISESSKLKEIIKENIEKVITGDGSNQIEEIDQEMLKVQEKLLKVANAKKDYTDLADKVEELRNEKEKILLTMAEEKNEQSRLMELEEFLKNQELEIESYDEDLVIKLVDKVVIYEERLKVIFKSGIEIYIEK